MTKVRISYWIMMLFTDHLLDARALFERVIMTFTPQAARMLWERWARYEYQYGDLASAQRLEKRISEVYPNGKLSVLAS